MRSGPLLVIASRAMMPMLIIEFLLGSYVSLFTAFPASTGSVNPFSQIFTIGVFWLALHVVVGFIILGLSITILALAPSSRNVRILTLGLLGLVAVTVTVTMGIGFVISGYTDNLLSYGMSVGFIFSFVLYGALAGTVNFFIRSMKRADASEA